MLVVPCLRERIGSRQDALKVLIVDRRPLFLAALAELIREGCTTASIETMTNSEHALLAALERPWQLIFCEVRATPLSGIDIAVRLTAAGLPTRVILIADAEDRHVLVGALGCGAAGFFTKDASPDEFLEGTEAVLAGHFVLGRELLPLTLERLEGKAQGHPDGTLGRLSDAERSILIMVGQARSTRAIAASRGVSEKTVRNHLASIYRKLAVRNRSEAIVWSARAGLTQLAGND